MPQYSMSAILAVSGGCDAYEEDTKGKDALRPDVERSMGFVLLSERLGKDGGRDGAATGVRRDFVRVLGRRKGWGESFQIIGDRRPSSF